MAVAVALAVAASLASCGEDDKSTAPAGTGAIDLTLRSDPGNGSVATGTLTCRPGEKRATGALAKRAPAARLCADAAALGPFLLAKSPGKRVCTQLYGGPQTARITGTIDGRRVNRTFRRTNGCEVEDYERVAKILPV